MELQTLLLMVPERPGFVGPQHEDSPMDGPTGTVSSGREVEHIDLSLQQIG